MDEDLQAEAVGGDHLSVPQSPTTKSRSLSAGEADAAAPRLSPSPRIIEATRKTSKDDMDIRDVQPPATPRRGQPMGQIDAARQFTPPHGNTATTPNTQIKQAPSSPQLENSQVYASPTNILPRRSRGLDFSRAATNLHHSTLAEQPSPESSPIVGGRGINIPSRRGGYAGAEQSSSSLWSVMGNHEKMAISSSLGSTQAVGSDTSSSSDDDLMDEDDETYVTTPQVHKTTTAGSSGFGNPFGSPAPSMGSPASFQHRQRNRKAIKKKTRAPFGLGFNIATASLSRSPPANNSRARRESITWQANQLHISTGDGDDTSRSHSDADGGPTEAQIRRVNARRGNLLPKTKTFARIRAALMEEGSPADAETKREAEVVKQVRDSDSTENRLTSTNLDLASVTAALSSPNLTTLDADEPIEDDMISDMSMGFSSSFKQQAMKNSKGKTFWDTFSESSSVGGSRASPPPAPFFPRGSSSGISEDAAAAAAAAVAATDSQFGQPASFGPQPPSAAEITRRINTKRRRDDDLDHASFKRRAVSPGLSAHNSPVIQSPMQRDALPWGTASRPSTSGPASGSADKGGTSSAQSDSGAVTPANSTSSGTKAGTKGRVGFQGMTDTNDGIMRMSIE